METAITGLAGREEEIMQQVDSLVSSKRQTNHEQAIQLLVDFKELAARNKQMEMFVIKIEKLNQKHRRKYNFIQRLVKADLVKVTQKK